jgi:hypothetical protein
VRDFSEINVREGQRLIHQKGMEAMAHFEKGGAFDRASVAAIAPRPTLGIVSGLYVLPEERFGVLLAAEVQFLTRAQDQLRAARLSERPHQSGTYQPAVACDVDTCIAIHVDHTNTIPPTANAPKTPATTIHRDARHAKGAGAATAGTPETKYSAARCAVTVENGPPCKTGSYQEPKPKPFNKLRIFSNDLVGSDQCQEQGSKGGHRNRYNFSLGTAV